MSSNPDPNRVIIVIEILYLVAVIILPLGLLYQVITAYINGREDLVPALIYIIIIISAQISMIGFYIYLKMKAKKEKNN